MASVLHELIRDAAVRDPRHEAVRFRGRSLTYRELDTVSDGVARTLVETGVRHGDRVAILLPKGIEAVIAIYGVMKAGAAYVPVDPKGPFVRAALIASDCTVSAVVSTPGRAEGLLSAMEEHRPQVALLVEDGSAGRVPCRALSFEKAIAEGAGRSSDLPSGHEQDLAYILYTSGSTGMPKGVMLTHRNALAFVEWSADAIGAGQKDVLSNHAPFHFDLSVFDLYLAALGGAAVVLVPEEDAYLGASLGRFMAEEGITIWYSVPAALMSLTRSVHDPGAFPSVRTVVFAGDVYPTKRLRELRALFPDTALWNLYGPTETNVCTYYRLVELPEDDRSIPIGHACEGVTVFAVRPDGAPAGVGEEGELYVGGPTVMKGYWNRLERTEQVLVRNPLDPDAPGRVYRTGDLVRLRADGDYDFVGRRDHQVKSHGYRIELGEVEAALNAHPAINEAVAVAVPHERWGAEIVAFAVPANGEALPATQVKRFVAGRLPRYMVPNRIEFVEQLPRTSTGKIDRQTVAARAGKDHS